MKKFQNENEPSLPNMVMKVQPIHFFNKNDIVYKLYRLKLEGEKDHIWSFSPSKC